MAARTAVAAPDDGDRLVDKYWAAARLGVRPRTVEKYREQGVLAVHKVGPKPAPGRRDMRAVRFRAGDVDSLIERIE